MSDEAARPLLLIGGNGQLGHVLQRELSALGPVISTTRERLDLADADSIQRVIRDAAPGIIVNAAAYTAVDNAETDEAACALINTSAPGVIADTASEVGATLIHFSTDFVFDGRKHSPYVEEDQTNPLNVYGRTKLLGEQAILATRANALIFRIGWVYGLYRTNFLNTVRRLAADRDALTVVNDQIGVPTWTGSVAVAVARVVSLVRSEAWTRDEGSARTGVYHMAGTGSASWAELAAEILKEYPVPGRERVTVTPITTAQFPRPATRPAYSVMSSEKLARTFGIALPDWREQLRSCLSAPAQ